VALTEPSSSGARLAMIIRLIGRGCAFPVEPQSDELEDTPSQREEEHDEQFNETEPAVHGLSIVPFAARRYVSRANLIKQFTALKALKQINEPDQLLA
jgi:hypothetical protein